MSIQQKITITNSLDEMLKEMRRICHAEGAPLGTLCPPHVCRHLVRALSISQPDIRTVASFHDFLLSDPYPNTSSSYLRWLRSLMKDDYRVVLSHGDFHLGNIIISDDDGHGNVKVNGIIDWEMGGWYPDYWEVYKALNTRSGSDQSDWWDNLPKSIAGYDQEVVALRAIEQSMMI